MKNCPQLGSMWIRPKIGWNLILDAFYRETEGKINHHLYRPPCLPVGCTDFAAQKAASYRIPRTKPPASRRHPPSQLVQVIFHPQNLSPVTWLLQPLCQSCLTSRGSNGKLIGSTKKLKSKDPLPSGHKGTKGDAMFLHHGQKPRNL